MAVGGTSVGKLVVEIVGDVAGLTKAYEEAQKQTDGFGSHLKTVGDSLSSVGKDLTLKVSAPLTLMGGLAFKTAVDFDDSMRKVAAVTGATGDQFDRLRQQAIDLGATTAWSASESAAAMQYLGMAGLDTNEILEATPQMLSLASAGATFNPTLVQFKRGWRRWSSHRRSGFQSYLSPIQTERDAELFARGLVFQSYLSPIQTAGRGARGRERIGLSILP